MGIPFRFNPLGTSGGSSDIVRDGLLVWLDGRDAPVGNVWQDRSGNRYDVTLYGAEHESAEKAYFFKSTDTANTYGDTAKNIPITGDAAFTMEMVATVTADSGTGGAAFNGVCCFGPGPYLGTAYQYAGLAIRYQSSARPGAPGLGYNNGTSYSTIDTDLGDKVFASFAKIPGSTGDSNNTVLFQNGIAATAVATSANTPNIQEGYLTVGRWFPATSTQPRGMNGYIHSLRIYNRRLTQSEQTQNYLHDLANFG